MLTYMLDTSICIYVMKNGIMAQTPQRRPG
jgi:hypothetical protein